MFHATSSSLNSLSKKQMGLSGCNERQITQSCTFSAVGGVLRLYLLCPCQPLLRGDCFDKRAQRGFMCLFPSYCQCKHCQPCKHTFKKDKEKRCWIKEAHCSFKEEFPARSDYKSYDLTTRRDLMDHFNRRWFFFLNLGAIAMFSTSVPVYTGSGSAPHASFCLVVWWKWILSDQWRKLIRKSELHLK